MRDLHDLAHRYVDMWNESDPEVRRMTIAELFAPDVAHYTPMQEVHGQAEMEARVAGSYEKWVRPGTHVFRAVRNATGHHNAVRFNWEMVDIASGKVRNVGFDFVLLDQEGLIKSDHQFVDR
ncbi:SnoaL-like protein [Micromonospora pisi]|uniref:SnoaL-like protein n=1 Tax=Micromonospora pisi TaxID=589240 RepID=A0A495JB82_9ACTN|nr:nuclear transport factor 2 family protein [Micromonospora pisi]RKR86187.1 SnoaL-like protein [Micromonospora pisi]